LFIRRIDDQVKIDGFRIELAEIEIVFMACENVSKAVAVVRNNKLALYVRHTDKEGHFDKKHFQQMMVMAGRSLTYYMMPK
jgi:acyl-coenzyme A synthetase/AMP-(fatty) acid ligase